MSVCDLTDLSSSCALIVECGEGIGAGVAPTGGLLRGCSCGLPLGCWCDMAGVPKNIRVLFLAAGLGSGGPALVACLLPGVCAVV